VRTRGVICAVTDRSRLAGIPSGCDGLVRRLALAAEAGVDLLQIREPDLSGGEMLALVRRVIAAVADTEARVVVNERLDVALAAGAHGVHLRGDSIATALARRLAPAGFLVGRSAHSADEAVRAADEGADYVVLGTVFESVSKPGRRAAGLALLEEAASRSAAPVIGIGGMTVDRAVEVAATGAAGIAAIGLFMAEQGDAGRVEGNLQAMVAGIRRAFDARAKENRTWP
jgi:thiamine-phosphate pyrophosphorylase